LGFFSFGFLNIRTDYYDLVMQERETAYQVFFFGFVSFGVLNNRIDYYHLVNQERKIACQVFFFGFWCLIDVAFII